MIYLMTERFIDDDWHMPRNKRTSEGKLKEHLGFSHKKKTFHTLHKMCKSIIHVVIGM